MKRLLNFGRKTHVTNMIQYLKELLRVNCDILHLKKKEEEEKNG